ncbi:DUF6628 family protein [Sphingomonas sp.]|uniref:DUF6628 family protein n=1 Tax=Sphingomonas sp. TaxID=28214 RepID=UPI0025D6EA98|nr:DUF6628 family protein [Sphingomonas sp.]
MPPSLTHALPAIQPEDAGARLFLFGVRQMGAHGLQDAAAAHAFITAFGKSFRRPLVLMRLLVQELSTASAQPIQIAPWCCRRMTGPEAALLGAVGHARHNRRAAAYLLADMLGVGDAGIAVGPLAAATAVAQAFADYGLPLEGAMSGASDEIWPGNVSPESFQPNP